MSDLPFEIDEEEGRAAEPQTLASNILVVDDEPVVRDVFSRLLARESDMVVTVAEDAEQGLELIKQRRFELLITDKNLPGMGGIELIAEARAVRPMIEAVMITGYASSESLISAFAAGASDYLVKPFDDLKVVRAKVRAALQRRLDRGRSQISSKDVARQAATMLGQGKDAPEPVWRKLDAKFAEYERAIRDGGSGSVMVVGSDRTVATLTQSGLNAERAHPSSPQVLTADVVVIETGPQLDWHPLAEKLMPLSPDVVLVAGPDADLSDLLEAISLRVDLVGFGGHAPARLLSDRVRANLMRRSVERAQRELAAALNEFKQSLRGRFDAPTPLVPMAAMNAPTPVVPMQAVTAPRSSAPAGGARASSAPTPLVPTPAIIASQGGAPAGAAPAANRPAVRVAPAPGTARTPVTPMGAMPAVGPAGGARPPSSPAAPGGRSPVTPSTAIPATGAQVPGTPGTVKRVSTPAAGVPAPGEGVAARGAAAAGEIAEYGPGAPEPIALGSPVAGTAAPGSASRPSGVHPQAAPAQGGVQRRPTGSHPQLGAAPAPTPGGPRPVGPPAARPGAPSAPVGTRPTGPHPQVTAPDAAAAQGQLAQRPPGAPPQAASPGASDLARGAGAPGGAPPPAGSSEVTRRGLVPRRPTGSYPQAGAPPAPDARRPSGSYPQVSLPELTPPQAAAFAPGAHSTPAAHRSPAQPPAPGAPPPAGAPPGRAATPPSAPAVSGQPPRAPAQNRPSGHHAPVAPAEALTEPAVQTMSVAAAEALLLQRERELERERENAGQRKEAAAEPPRTKPPAGGNH